MAELGMATTSANDTIKQLDVSVLLEQLVTLSLSPQKSRFRPTDSEDEGFRLSYADYCRD